MPGEADVLRSLSALVAQHLGLYFPEERWPDLLRGAAAAAEDVGIAHPEGWLGVLGRPAPSQALLDALAAHLTVAETYFFRDPASFALLERELLTSLIAQRAPDARTLRLWSAGCCTGEEAYSLAIASQRALPDPGSWSVSVLATDVNRRALDRARAGVYSRWSFRGCGEALLGRYFQPAEGQALAIVPEIRRLVHFAHLNLAQADFPSVATHTVALDVIFCRNVLMYLTEEHQRRVVAALHASLVEGGWLLVGAAEASAALMPMFAMEERDGVILLRKGPATARPVRVFEAPAPPAPAVVDPPPAGQPRPAPEEAAAGFAGPPEGGWLALARAQADSGALEEALVSCGRAIAAARTAPAAHLLHAVICQQLGRPEEAVAALGRVLYLEPRSIIAHHALGGLHQRLGRPREAARHYALVLRLLEAHGREEIVPDSDGMTCGRLAESVRAAVGA
ncbi:MAG: CheR family methyltransferase [Pseudomonadota bacterium]